MQLGGANCECNNSVWRIDVGMSYGVLNRPVQVWGGRGRVGNCCLPHLKGRACGP